MEDLPNFFIPGFSRSGSTWVWNILKFHPSVYLPSKKEIHYFDYNFEKPISYYQSFYKASSQPIRGDLTPTYCQKADTFPRFYQHVRDAKLLFLIRNSINFLYSNFKKMHRERGSKIGVNSFNNYYKDSINQRLYFNKMKPYLDHYNSKIGIFEIIHKDRILFLNELMDFLSIDINENGYLSIIKDSIDAKVNYSTNPKFKVIHSFAFIINKKIRNNNSSLLNKSLNYIKPFYRV